MEEIILDYRQLFGVAPNTMGLFWNNADIILDSIEGAIENGKPYDE